MDTFLGRQLDTSIVRHGRACTPRADESTDASSDDRSEASISGASEAGSSRRRAARPRGTPRAGDDRAVRGAWESKWRNVEYDLQDAMDEDLMERPSLPKADKWKVMQADLWDAINDGSEARPHLRDSKWRASDEMVDPIGRSSLRSRKKRDQSTRDPSLASSGLEKQPAAKKAAKAGKAPEVQDTPHAERESASKDDAGDVRQSASAYREGTSLLSNAPHAKSSSPSTSRALSPGPPAAAPSGADGSPEARVIGHSHDPMDDAERLRRALVVVENRSGTIPETTVESCMNQLNSEVHENIGVEKCESSAMPTDSTQATINGERLPPDEDWSVASGDFAEDAVLDLGDEGKPSHMPLRGIRCMWGLWVCLIALSCIQLVLIGLLTWLDRTRSPCRVAIEPCHSLHGDDCSGGSCKGSAPLWAGVWPLAGLFTLALPLRSAALFGRGSDGSSLQWGAASSGHWRRLLFAVAAATSLCVFVAGATALIEISEAAGVYAARCPMARAAVRCSASLCPSPPCKRESTFSPCMCGRLGEEEMARALFLSGDPACQPYEWYVQQMEELESIVLRYENFACIVGPLGCGAVAVGACLLLVQFACCPLLLLGRWGGREAVFFLLATDDELDRALVGNTGDDAAKGTKGDFASLELMPTALPLGKASAWTSSGAIGLEPCHLEVPSGIELPAKPPRGEAATARGVGEIVAPDSAPHRPKA